jgi:hypothetical protein
MVIAWIMMNSYLIINYRLKFLNQKHFIDLVIIVSNLSIEQNKISRCKKI